jgi:hypothetical protein
MFLGGIGLLFVVSTLAVMAEEAAGHRKAGGTPWTSGVLRALFAVNAWGYAYLRKAEARGWFEYPTRSAAGAAGESGELATAPTPMRAGGQRRTSTRPRT